MKKTYFFKTLILLILSWLTMLTTAQTTVTWPLQSTRTPDISSGTGWTASSQGILDGTTYLIHGSYVASKSADGSAAVQKVAAYTQSSSFLTQNDNYYVEYTITPSSNYSISISSVIFDLGAGSSTAQKASFYYSTDGFTTRTALGGYTNAAPKTWSATLSSDKLTGTEGTDRFTFNSLNISSSNSFKLRIYLWCTSNSSSARNYSHSNVKITFTASEVVGCVDASVSNPSAAQVCQSGTASISVTGGGSAPSYQWQYSADNSTNWANVVDGTPANITYSNATTNTLGITAAAGASGGYYRCVVSSTCSGNTTTATSTGALFTVNPASVGGTALATASTVSWGGSTTVSVSGQTGNVQWQQSLDNSTWTDISGATTTSITTPAVTATTWYRAKVTSGNCTEAYSNAVSVGFDTYPTGSETKSWNFSAKESDNSTLVWNEWITTSTSNRVKNGLVSYATVAKALGVTASTSGTYTHRVKFDKSIPTTDINGKPVFYAIGFPVSGRGTLTLTFTSGGTIDGLITLYHFNATQVSKTAALTSFTSPNTSGGANTTITYEYDGSRGAGELILAQATATQGTNILEMKWTNNLLLNAGSLSSLGKSDADLENNDWEVRSGELTIDQSKTFKSIKVSAGARLTVSGSSPVFTNGVTLESDANGTATLVDDLSSSSINATVKQYVTAGRNWYMSAPLNNTANVSDLNKGASVQYYDESTGSWEIASGTLTRGKGYIQVANSTQGTTGTVHFAGIVNSGDVPVTLTHNTAGRGFNLVGNPYPSYLNWSAVATDPVNTQMTTGANMPTGTMWYRTINYNGKNAWTPNNAYNVDDIVYNGTRFYKVITAGTSAASGGPTGTSSGIADNTIVWDYQGSVYIFATVSADGITAPSTVSNLIPPMQAFWVRTNTGGGTLTFKNSMRSHESVSNKLKAPQIHLNNLPFVRISVSNGTSNDETVIYFSSNATNAFDKYDAPKFFNTSGSNQAEIFTHVGTEKLAINALNNPDTNSEIAMGFATEKANRFNLSAIEIKNLTPNRKLMLYDKFVNKEFDLSDGQKYEFNSEIYNDINRFSLFFRTPEQSTGFNNRQQLNSSIKILNDNQVRIKTSIVCEIYIFNVLGQIVNQTLERESIFDCTLPEKGVYIIQFINKGILLSTQKISI